MQFPSIVVTIGNQAEKVYAMGNPGRRHIRYEVTLFIQTIDPNPNEQASQDSFDDFVDAIDTQLRSDKTLGGTVLYSAQDKIDTEVFGPEVAGQGVSILLRAMKTFDVVLEIIG